MLEIRVNNNHLMFFNAMSSPPMLQPNQCWLKWRFFLTFLLLCSAGAFNAKMRTRHVGHDELEYCDFWRCGCACFGVLLFVCATCLYGSSIAYQSVDLRDIKSKQIFYVFITCVHRYKNRCSQLGLERANWSINIIRSLKVNILSNKLLVI